MAMSGSRLALRASPALRPAAALLYGGLVVGVVDLIDAIVFFGLRGVAPVRILQTIAEGLLGAAAYAGGLGSALLGWCLHFFIAFVIVLVYLVASRVLPALARAPYVFGPLYGLGVYAIMNYVVIPLSAAASGAKPTAVIVNGLLIHALGVGLPSALFARAAAPRVSLT